MKLLSCIAPALRRGLQVKPHIASARQVGLLPKDFKLTANFNWEQNVLSWRGPWVQNVLEQDCVVGAGLRELDAATAKIQRDARIEQTLQMFGLSSVYVPDAAQSDLLVDPRSFEAFTRASFAGRPEAEVQQLKTILGGWEQIKKDIAAAAKREKSRTGVSAVNALDLEALQQEAQENEASKLEDDKAALGTMITHCTNRAEESMKQYKLAVKRGVTCESMLADGSGVQPFEASHKRQIEMLLNNVRNGDALWHAAEEYGKKIRRMDLAGNVEAAATRAEFLTQWPEIEERKYEIDVDRGLEMAANLAGVSEQNMEEMFVP